MTGKKLKLTNIFEKIGRYANTAIAVAITLVFVGAVTFGLLYLQPSDQLYNNGNGNATAGNQAEITQNQDDDVPYIPWTHNDYIPYTALEFRQWRDRLDRIKFIRSLDWDKGILYEKDSYDELPLVDISWGLYDENGDYITTDAGVKVQPDFYETLCANKGQFVGSGAYGFGVDGNNYSIFAPFFKLHEDGQITEVTILIPYPFEFVESFEAERTYITVVFDDNAWMSEWVYNPPRAEAQ
jgi:hypothetical protein